MLLTTDEVTAPIRDGLAILGNQRMVLAIHDASFPSVPGEDIGQGSPYGSGARRLLSFVASLGFNGIQLGPQGATTLFDPSPYGSALLSKTPCSIALGTLQEDPAWTALCDGLLDAVVGSRPEGPDDRVQLGYAWKASRDMLAALHARFRPAGGACVESLAGQFADFCRRRGDVLQFDADFEALTAAHGSDDWHRWPGLDVGSVDQCLHSPPPTLAHRAAQRRAELRRLRATEIDRYLFGQFILDQQHAVLRQTVAQTGGRAGGLALYGDLQIGYSHRDVWSRRGLFLADYLMGAPPSRTNPEGQPWGYPVLDPNQYFVASDIPGAALQLLTTRVDRMLAEFDGIRIDHPHGLVCPWVYSAHDPDPIAAVARGARLFCSPNLPDHPALAAFAIPSPEQLSRDPGIVRYADDWVRELRDDQVTRYGVLFDAIMSRITAAGRQRSDVVCEVLSTWPFPLRAVMNRYGLGRLCVTQKADLTRADDVYRSENATDRDWIMVGNHDTRPIWRVADSWHGTAAGTARAEYLARRLMPLPALRERLVRWLDEDAGHLCQGLFAELLASRARHVSVFFADLFGIHDVYNVPGLIDPSNWTLRLPPTFEQDYQRRVKSNAACNVPLVLALALIARAASAGDERLPAGAELAGTVRRLLDAACRLSPSLSPEITSLVKAALVMVGASQPDR